VVDTISSLRIKRITTITIRLKQITIATIMVAATIATITVTLAVIITILSNNSSTPLLPMARKVSNSNLNKEVVAMEEDRCLMVSHAVAEVTKPNNR
jgi:hypothetical protein